MLERGETFLNLEMHWDSPVLRNIGNKDRHQGITGDIGGRVINPLGGGRVSEEWESGCSEHITSQGRGLDLIRSVAGSP